MSTSSSDRGPGPAGTASRREFLKASASVSAASLVAGIPLGPRKHGGSDTIRVGVIGCGGRGRGAAVDCVRSSKDVKIVALGDVFPDRIEEAIAKLGKAGVQVEGGREACFHGVDAYRKVLEADVNLVILATPPGFRPLHLKAAIEAGKHVFAEKPVAVDPAGVRLVIEASELASARGLSIVAGTQRRHERCYLEVMQRVRDGAIGEIVGGHCYWNQGTLWVHDRKEAYSDVEWQIRNWLYFTWLSGDHIVEQHVHNIDVMNWAFGGPPAKAMGMGGRQVRTQERCGHIFDHFAIEFEYAGGARVTSMCRQIDGTQSRIGERLIGTAGSADPARWIKGRNAFRYPRREDLSPYVREHADLIAGIRSGKPLNEGRRIAESTLTAIMGRMSAYTGKEVTWEFAMKSKLDLHPRQLTFGDMPVAPVPVPGRTPLI